MINARFVRVEMWPRPQATSYKAAQFKAPYNKTLALLEREINHLRGQDVLIQTYHERRDIRLNGWPRSDARVPPRPGVIVTFGLPEGSTLSFPCDRFDHWEDNLRAIALALEALRMADRYGVTRGTEQYRGFEALPPPGANAGDMTRRGAALTLLAESQVSSAITPENIEYLSADGLGEIIRAAQRNAHPDKGGSMERFNLVQKAAAVLRGKM